MPMAGTVITPTMMKTIVLLALDGRKKTMQVQANDTRQEWRVPVPVPIASIVFPEDDPPSMEHLKVRLFWKTTLVDPTHSWERIMGAELVNEPAEVFLEVMERNPRWPSLDSRAGAR